jgi:hypothetical protein
MIHNRMEKIMVIHARHASSISNFSYKPFGGDLERAVHIIVGPFAVFPRSPGWSCGIQASSGGEGYN